MTPGSGPIGTALLCLGRCQCAPRNKKVRTKCTGAGFVQSMKGQGDAEKQSQCPDQLKAIFCRFGGPGLILE